MKGGAALEAFHALDVKLCTIYTENASVIESLFTHDADVSSSAFVALDA